MKTSFGLIILLGTLVVGLNAKSVASNFQGEAVTESIASPITKPWAIFGEDNRQEVFTVTPEWQKVSESIAGKVSVEHISGSKLEGVPLGRRVCPTNRFADQITVPSCTGFLVKPNILITAGHCMNTPEDCSQNLWVFGYILKNDGDKNYQNVNSDQIYRCKNVISRRIEGFGAVDYTIIELDRNVVNREPLKLGFHLGLQPGQAVVSIGHSNGLPMKFVDGAAIVGIADDNRTIETNLDQFGGNSGGPVFDAVSKEVIGITSHGTSDYVKDGDKGCKIARVCKPEDKCYWSASSRVTNLLTEPIFSNEK